MSGTINEIKATIKHHKEQEARCQTYVDDAQRRLEKRQALVIKYEEQLSAAQNPKAVAPVLKKAAEKKIEKAAKTKKVAKPAKVEKTVSKPAAKLTIKKVAAASVDE
jgi:hypothetical protein